MKAVLDACVLYPTVLREILLGVAARGLYEPLWSDRILREWTRATAKLGPLAQAQAEAEGLDHIFMAAGLQWREPGCSMCLGMNDDRLSPGERCASTSNRNFEGRQGPGGRSHLLSPALAAAAAIAGRLARVEDLEPLQAEAA